MASLRLWAYACREDASDGRSPCLSSNDERTLSGADSRRDAQADSRSRSLRRLPRTSRKRRTRAAPIVSALRQVRFCSDVDAQHMTTILAMNVLR